VVVYACTQAMFRTRDQVAAVLGKSPSQVRVYAMPVGGGFGGKFGLIEPLVAALSVAVGRPVLLAYTRIEDFTSASPAPSSIFREELAAAGPNEGVGVALGGWFGGTEPASALCRLESDGTLKVAIGSVDLTGTNKGLQVIAAEAFGLDSADDVRVSTVDTDAA